MNEASAGARKACQPFGDPNQAEVWVIGHDPRLQKSEKEAKSCFFLDLLAPGRPLQPDERKPREFAAAVLKYVQELAGPITPDSLYATNLCNTFLERPKARGVILIPDVHADAGAHEIRSTLREVKTRPRVIIPMSQQVLYHLSRTGCLSRTAELDTFLNASSPSKTGMKQGIYRARKPAAFVGVCGRQLAWDGVPVVPVLHISSRQRIPEPYLEPMRRASQLIQALLLAQGPGE